MENAPTVVAAGLLTPNHAACLRSRSGVAAAAPALFVAAAAPARRADHDLDRRGAGGAARDPSPSPSPCRCPAAVYVCVASRRRPGRRRRTPTSPSRSSPSGSTACELNSTVSGAVPVFGSAAAVTVGAWLPAGLPTTIGISAVSVPPRPSDAVTVARVRAGAACTCARPSSRAPAAEPSSKSHVYVSSSPSGSVPCGGQLHVAAARRPRAGTHPPRRLGARLPTGLVTTISTVSVAVAPDCLGHRHLGGVGAGGVVRVGRVLRQRRAAVTEVPRVQEVVLRPVRIVARRVELHAPAAPGRAITSDVASTVGGTTFGPVTTTWTSFEDCLPSSSVAVTFAVYVPGVVYVRVDGAAERRAVGELPLVGERAAVRIEAGRREADQQRSRTRATGRRTPG